MTISGMCLGSNFQWNFPKHVRKYFATALYFKKVHEVLFCYWWSYFTLRCGVCPNFCFFASIKTKTMLAKHLKRNWSKISTWAFATTNLLFSYYLEFEGEFSPRIVYAQKTFSQVRYRIGQRVWPWTSSLNRVIWTPDSVGAGQKRQPTTSYTCSASRAEE